MGRKALPRVEGRPINLTKAEIFDLWENAPESGPILLEPIEYGHKGTTFLHDTIRITGSQQHINSVLGRLKPLLELDNDSTSLRVNYQQIVEKVKREGTWVSGELTESWSCYVKAQRKSGRGTGRPPGQRAAKLPDLAKNDPAEVVEPSTEINEKLPPSQRARVEPEVQTGPVQGPRPKGWKKPKSAPPTIPPALPTRKGPEPVYGIGVRDGNDWNWTEPSGVDGYPCDVYPDIEACSDAINSLKRGKNGLKDALEIVELIKAGGKVQINPVV